METLGFLTQYPVWTIIVGFFIIATALAFFGAPLWLWALAGFATLWGLHAPVWLMAAYAVICLIFNIKPVRRAIITLSLIHI